MTSTTHSSRLLDVSSFVGILTGMALLVPVFVLPEPTLLAVPAFLILVPSLLFGLR